MKRRHLKPDEKMREVRPSHLARQTGSRRQMRSDEGTRPAVALSNDSDAYALPARAPWAAHHSPCCNWATALASSATV